MLHDPLLHDIIKAYLTYKYNLVWKLLKIHYPSWNLLQNWKITKVYQEYFTSKRTKVDVVWEIIHLKQNKKAKIVHEIKTTKEVNVEEIWDKYREISSFVFIWKYRKAKLINVLENKIQSGWIRIIPLEILFPRIKEELKNIFSFLNRF